MVFAIVMILGAVAVGVASVVRPDLVPQPWGVVVPGILIMLAVFGTVIRMFGAMLSGAGRHGMMKHAMDMAEARIHKLPENEQAEARRKLAEQRARMEQELGEQMTEATRAVKRPSRWPLHRIIANVVGYAVITIVGSLWFSGQVGMPVLIGAVVVVSIVLQLLRPSPVRAAMEAQRSEERESAPAAPPPPPSTAKKEDEKPGGFF